MELTPQQIERRRNESHVRHRLDRSLAGMDWDRIERAALKKFPPLFRRTQPVSPVVAAVQFEMARRTCQSRA
jgi:hypothetical protein